MSLNPVTASKEIFDRYCSYITTTFRLNREDLNKQIENSLRVPGKFAKGPILQIIPPFLAGRSIAELIANNELNEEFQVLNTKELPPERALFYHQEDAIRTMCKMGKSAVVATGTGSGKTECFLIPILNHLLDEKKQGTLDAGVRALLLYPMNALANDQIKRLRALLINEPKITFGIYTGETENYQNNALEKYLRMYGRDPLVNEIISRERMREEPPQILLTNYAMLEYLMLRPDDNVFFQGLYANKWQFIVLDEAHTYTGAKGIEMAMLLARLKNAVGAKKGDLRFVLTSATLGKGKEDAKAVAKFAEKLTGEDFTEEQVITAIQEEEILPTNSWGKPQPLLYQKLQLWLEVNAPQEKDIAKTLGQAGVPDLQIQDFLKLVKDDLSDALFSLLQGDQRVAELISLMKKDGPSDLYSLTEKMFGKEKDALKFATSFIDLCNRVRPRKGDNALLPARYHFFVKALEGAFIIFTPKTQISLERMKEITENDKNYKAFELGACTRCHGLYLIGEITFDTENGYSYLEPVTNNYNMESTSRLEFFALSDKEDSQFGNEDDVLEGLGLDVPSLKQFRLCVYCGGIGHDTEGKFCTCGKPRTIKIIKVNHKGRAVHKCGLCGSTSSHIGVVRRFYLSEDAISSVLSTALYQHLPGRVLESIRETRESIFGAELEMATKLDDKVKQLLIFSDSRQNAAFFAPYLSSTYNDLLAGNLLLRTILEYEQECLDNRWTLADYNRRIHQLVKKHKVLRDSVETLERLFWQWIMQEFTMLRGRFSLENMGLLAFLPNFEQLENCELLWNFRHLLDVGINPQEAQVLYSFLIDQFRRHRAVEYPEAVSPRDEFFAPQNQQGGFWSRKPAGINTHPGGYSLRGWLPTKGYANTRTDYLEKVLRAAGIDKPKEKSSELLESLWQTLIDPHSPLSNHIITETLQGQGKIYKLDPSLFKVAPGMDNPELTHYRCDTCYRITRFNLRGVCPAYGCSGSLRAADLDGELKDNHYRNLYMQMKPEKMETHEHTAQLATEYAAQVQTDFIQGKINVLSCSTTFELGVDVGELETVYMKNVPPTPANYAQRAGRAGRRIDATAFALTFARLASHDFSQFDSPEKMISGVMQPPYFNVDNEKIARRHLYACAFAHFWRAHRSHFGVVDKFFGQDGPVLFRKHLSQRPARLLESLKAIFSPAMQEKLGINTWTWLDDMYEDRGVMTKVVKEIMGDLDSIEEGIKKAASEDDFVLARKLQKTRRTIEKRYLINYLAQKSVLPKYGFPVDVVSLDVNMHTREAKNVDLSRDLQIAIGEYAPDGQVVANSRLWTSRYVKRVKERELVHYHYIQCRCGYLGKVFDVEIESTSSPSCPLCNQETKSQTFVVPEFGFIAEEKTKKPGTKRPERTYSCRKFFSGEGSLIDSISINLGENKILVTAQTHGVLTVVNNGLGNGFYICSVCGYGTCHNRPPEKHKNAYGGECLGGFKKVALGYNLETDIVRIDCFQALGATRKPAGYWESLLYSLIEGMGEELEIARNDLDGTIYFESSGQISLILFDTVPGGAGHVKRLLEKGVLETVINTSLKLLKRCSCGGKRADTSCYGCLRNYQNQFVHDLLRRDYGIDALKRILGKRYSSDSKISTEVI